jgi:hypothetical protein
LDKVSLRFGTVRCSSKDRDFTHGTAARPTTRHPIPTARHLGPRRMCPREVAFWSKLSFGGVPLPLASAPHFRSPNHLGFLSSGEQARAREWRARRHRRASGRGRAASSSSRDGRESSPPEGKHTREGCELVAVGGHERARELGATVASDTVDILGAGDGGVLS